MLKLSGPAITKANLEVATLSEFKTFANMAGQIADDARMNQVVDGVNRSLYNKLRQRVIKSTGTAWDYLLDGAPIGDPVLVLPHRPLVSLTRLESGQYVAGSGWVPWYVWVTGDYVLDTEEGMIWAADGLAWPQAPNSVRVTWQAGWTSPPEDLKHALLQWMAVEYARAAAPRLDQTSRSDEAGSDTYTFGTIPATAEAVLRRYMRAYAVLGAY